MSTKALSATEIKALWTHFDRNKDGVITKDEFSDFITLNLSRLYSVPKPLPPALVDEAFSLIDTNSGGFINFEEFRNNINNYWQNKESILQKHVSLNSPKPLVTTTALPVPAGPPDINAALVAELAAAKAAVAAANRMASERAQKITDLEWEISGLRAEIVRLKNLLSARDAEISDLRGQLQRLRSSKSGEKALDELEEAKRARGALEAEQQSTQRLRGQFAALEAVRREEEDELARLRRENKNLARSIEDARNNDETVLLRIQLKTAQDALAKEKERQIGRDQKLMDMQDMQRKFLALETEFATERQRFLNYRALLKERWRAEEKKILFLMDNPKFRVQHAASLETARASCEHLLHEIENLWNSPKRFFPRGFVPKVREAPVQVARHPEFPETRRARSPPFRPPGPTSLRPRSP